MMYLWIFTYQWTSHNGDVRTKTLFGREDLRRRSKEDLLRNVIYRAASGAGVEAESLAVLVFTVEKDEIPDWTQI